MNEPRPQRPIGMISLVCLVIGNMIGASVYVSSSYAMSDLGDQRVVLLVWALGGLHAMAGAVAYAALAKRMAISGGEYSYLTKCVHPVIGFIAGWISLLAGFTAPIAATALLFGVYITGTGADSIETRTAGTLAIVVAAVMHCVNLRAGSWVNNGVVFVKLFFVALFILSGLFYIYSGPLPFSPSDTVAGNASGTQTLWQLVSSPGMSTKIVLSLFWISLAYTGFNASIYIAGEVDGRIEAKLGDDGHGAPDGGVAVTAQHSEAAELQYKPIVGRSMIVACVLVTAVYLLINYVFLYALPTDKIISGRENFASDVAYNVGGDWMRSIMRAVIALSGATSILAMVATGPRVYAQMAADGKLPKFFDSQDDAPRLAILFQAALSCVVVWITYLKQLIEYLGLTLSACGALAICTLWISRKQLTKRYPIRWYEHVCAAIYVGVAVVLLWYAGMMKREQFMYCVGTFASGIVIYFVAKLIEKRN